MQCKITNGLSHEKVARAVPSRYRGLLPAASSGDHLYTLMQFRCDSEDVILSSTVGRALSKHVTPQGETIVAVGGAFTREASGLLDERGAIILQLNPDYWSDQSYGSVRDMWLGETQPIGAVGVSDRTAEAWLFMERRVVDQFRSPLFIGLYRTLITEKAEADPSFCSSLRQCALQAIASGDSGWTRRGLHALAIVGKTEDLAQVEAMTHSADEDVARDAKTSLFELRRTYH
ncbi:MAG: hypothetical protein HQ559_02480 [Lentisphaerae bacterium]|nr:hypothetical protein [Lentisphaerota bacterium]